MVIDDKNAERIAKELIAEIASAWTPIPGTEVCLTEGEPPLFEFVIQPTRVVRYATRVQRPLSPTLVRFNPLAEATEIVIQIAWLIDPLGAPMTPALLGLHDSRIRRQSKEKIHKLLLIAPEVFREATWQASTIAETLCGLESMRVIGRPDIARGLVNATINQIEGRIYRFFGEVSKARNPKITEHNITTALQSYLPKFEQTGEIPSIRQFAKTLGVSRKGWRQYLKTRGYPHHDVAITQWLDGLSKVRSDTVGTISQEESPSGDEGPS